MKEFEQGQIEVNSDAWTNLLSEIASEYADGTIIKHDWLKAKFGLKPPSYEDYDNVTDFMHALDIRQYAYMGLIDQLRWQLLEQEQYYIKNVRGIGYVIVPPTEQVEYGYDEFRDDIRKAVKRCNAIMTYTRFTNGAQAAKDRDLKAKFDSIRQLLQNVRK